MSGFIYVHIPFGAGWKVYGYLLALPLPLRARLPRPPSSNSPSGKQGSLEEKKHIGLRIFTIYMKTTI
jgi:hypothetical protein